MKKLFVTFTLIFGLTLLNSVNNPASADETDGCFYLTTSCGFEGWVCLPEGTTWDELLAQVDELEDDFCGQ
jgi:hypothetical protein